MRFLVSLVSLLLTFGMAIGSAAAVFLLWAAAEDGWRVWQGGFSDPETFLRGVLLLCGGLTAAAFACLCLLAHPE